MVLKTTKWKVKTCPCVLEYTWDDSVTPIEKTLKNFIIICPNHQALSDTDRWNTIWDENPKVSLSLYHILDNSPTTSLYDIIDGSRQLKQSITFSYSYSGTAPNRVLTISFTGISLTTNQKNTIQSLLNNKFGVGKVILA